jgi:hypothetical protein
MVYALILLTFEQDSFFPKGGEERASFLNKKDRDEG